ncbi:MAG: hypothetical protein ABF651_05365 [Sporolactobacillus sp.]
MSNPTQSFLPISRRRGNHGYHAFFRAQTACAIWTDFLHPARQLGNDVLILFIVLADLSLFFMTGMIIRRLLFLTASCRYLEQKYIVDFDCSKYVCN